MSLIIIKDDSPIPEDNVIVFGRQSNGLQGKKIAEMISANNASSLRLVSLGPYHLDSINRAITHIRFSHMTTVYENNQLYYLNDVRNNKESLYRLEEWFIQIIEPVPLLFKEQRREDWLEEINEWFSREKAKLKGYTSYCDNRCRIRSVRGKVLERVKDNFKAVFTRYTLYKQ